MEASTMQSTSKKADLLHMKDVYKQYGTKVILDNIDLTVRRGELCTLVGPSGCGKSTLLRLVLGQERVTDGEILIDGAPVGLPDTDRGIVYQRYSLYPHLTVLQNVTLGMRLSAGFMERRRKGKQFRDEARYHLERTGLEGHGSKYPHELSGGMQQRVAIAQALVMRPKILLMDEPFGALDPGTREDMQVFILELWNEYRMTVFFVTHDLEEAVFLGTRILVLSQYYRDGRGDAVAHRGAKIVSDYQCAVFNSTEAKETPAFGKLIGDIRREGFDPAYRQHVTEFNLRHDDSFQTLLDEERSL